MEFISWIVVGIAAGWLAGVVTRTDRGILGDLVLGLVGAFVAGWVTDLSIGEDSLIWSILVAAAFAALLVLVKNLILGRRS